MKKTRVFLFAVIGSAGLLSGAVAGPSPVEVQAQRLVDDSGGSARLTTHEATGAVRFVRLSPGSLPLSGASREERAGDFFRRYGGVMGVKDPASELSAPLTKVDSYGMSHVSYEQRYQGLPVFAGRLRVHFDAETRLAAVNGTFVPDITVEVTPRRPVSAAVAAALSHVRTQFPAETVEARGTRLLVFRTGLLRRVPGRDHLAVEVEVGNGDNVREIVFVDAHTGKVLDQITGIHHVVDRQIHEPRFNDSVIWSEGDALPYSTGDTTNDDQVNNLVDRATDVYDLFMNLSGGTFESWDGSGGTMHSVWKAPINCPNASWNGTSTNYCNGTASDDVIAHEWTHAYTERTHGLIYQWQPGALNESYSDIFGEIVDVLDGSGTDTPDVARVPEDCSTLGGNHPPDFQVNAPASISGSYVAGGAAFNPSPPLQVTAGVTLADDGDDEGGAASVNDACQPLVGFPAGDVALIDRGTCSFSSKALTAQNAGAVAMILVNSSDSTFTLSGSDPSITIPSVVIGSGDGALLKSELGAGVNVTLSFAESTAVSIRWLAGEDSFAFGGAIRDLWNPSCFGDPAKTTDPLYYCATFDSGGVHVNSGVPNHGFALLVDGGAFNGRTVPAIGLTKAAHAYWRAMSVYQVPDSDFADHADALAQSCADLIGVDLADLDTGSPSGELIDAADCSAVTEAMLAVEMTEAPPCAFTPLLDPNAPSPTCGAVAYFDDFETDPTAAWSRSNSGVYAEYSPRDWEWTSSVPFGGSGAAFFAVDSLYIGNCIQGDDDQSGMMSLDSPTITLGGDASLAFDHYVATERSYDGGNLKVSVNGAPFQLVAAGDFTFNPYNGAFATSEAGNTNPLAGEAAFTGSDGGQVGGSWGQSHVDLSAVAGAGDTIRLRFDLGVDGCNGLDGWYVDNVLVCTTENGAGSVPDGAGVSGSPLTVDRASGGQIQLSWGSSCSSGDADYEIYEGTLGDFTSHTSKLCSTGGSTSLAFDPAVGSSYYLVVPASIDREGSYGTDSDRIERPQGAQACLPQALVFDCQ